MRYLAVALLMGTLSLVGCEQPPQEGVSAPPNLAQPSVQPLSASSQERMKSLKLQGEEWLSQLQDCVTQLESDTRQLLAISNEANLENVKQLWYTCNTQYQATELLVGVTEPQQQAMLKVRHNIAAPLELPGYIDSIEGYPSSGIVNDTSLAISETTLRQQQGLTSDEDVALGFDVIAFLVWGEQRFNPQLPERPVAQLKYATAWENGRTDLPVSEHPQNRRRLYLQLATTLLKLDCSRLLEVWKKGPLPFSEQAAQQWQLQILQNGLTLLERYPSNSDVQMALNQWLNHINATADNQDSNGAVTVPTDTSELRAGVQQAINNLLTKQG